MLATNEGTVPFNLDGSKAINPGYEAHSITELSIENDKKAVLKEVDPLNFHLPAEIKTIGERITDPVKRAEYIARYKKDEYEQLATILGDQVAKTDYIVYRKDENIRVGIIQPKIEGETVGKLMVSGRITEDLEQALQIFLDLLSKAQSVGPKIPRVISGHIPSAKDILSRSFEPPDYMPDVCNLPNLIYVPTTKKIIAVDW